MTLRKDNKTGVPGIAWDTRRGAYQVRVNNRSCGYYDDFELAKAVHSFIKNWPQAQKSETSNDWLSDWSKP